MFPYFLLNLVCRGRLYGVAQQQNINLSRIIFTESIDKQQPLFNLLQ